MNRLWISPRLRLARIGLCWIAAAPAMASFHLMQIEQVIGGVNGDTSVQAIQLRMRTAGQNLVSQGRVRVHDAAGLNPIIIMDMTTNVPNGAVGDRVLIASANFPASTSPNAVPDFTMTNLIPASYLAAGSLTFESNGGIIYWRLSWGGAAYTGPNTGNVINDADGNFGPPFAGPLPSASLQAVQFTGPNSNLSSTNNAADYSVTSGAAIFTNNARNAFTVSPPPPPTGACCLADVSCSVQTFADCAAAAGTYLGDGTNCDSGPCGGACCTNGVCALVPFTQAEACATGGGTYLGTGTTCAPNPCACPGERGDADCSGNIDFFDIDPFLLALFDTPAYLAIFCGGQTCAVDVDCSNMVDFFDIDPLLSCLFSACPPCP